MNIRPVLLALVFLSCTGTARADPITAVYHVQVTDRMTPASNPNWLPFEQEFMLQMTFDPALLAAVNTGHTYGPAQFSAVPLPAVGPPAGVTLTTTGTTWHGQFQENDNIEPFNLLAVASQHEVHLGAEWHFFRSTRLATNILAPVPAPPYTAETFPHHVILDSFPFGYGVSLFQIQPTVRLIDGIDYRGVATLVEVDGVAPVPEPATLALVGGSLLLMARTRRGIKRPSYAESDAGP